jgi:hypothetical protein
VTDTGAALIMALHSRFDISILEHSC